MNVSKHWTGFSTGIWDWNRTGSVLAPEPTGKKCSKPILVIEVPRGILQDSLSLIIGIHRFSLCMQETSLVFIDKRGSHRDYCIARQEVIGFQIPQVSNTGTSSVFLFVVITMTG